MRRSSSASCRRSRPGSGRSAAGGRPADRRWNRSFADYFLRGRFDAADLAALTLGSLAAAAVLHLLHENGRRPCVLNRLAALSLLRALLAACVCARRHRRDRRQRRRQPRLSAVRRHLRRAGAAADPCRGDRTGPLHGARRHAGELRRHDGECFRQPRLSMAALERRWRELCRHRRCDLGAPSDRRASTSPTTRRCCGSRCASTACPDVRADRPPRGVGGARHRVPGHRAARR